MKSLHNKSSAHDQIFAMRDHNNQLHSDKSTVADILNDFICNIGTKLHDLIPAENGNTLITADFNSDSMSLYNTTPDEIATKIRSLKLNNSPNDIINSALLKACAHTIAGTISKCINHCFTTGTCPDELKIARVVPILKTGDRTDCNNYRPINTLPALAKIFDSILFDRLYSFANRFGLIDKFQFGFQKQSGTLSATSYLINLIQTLTDASSSKIAGCAFIDLTKAFDTIPRDILLDK